MSSNSHIWSRARTRRAKQLRFFVLKPGNKRTLLLEQELFEGQYCAFLVPLGVPPRSPDPTYSLKDHRYDNNWLSFHIVCRYKHEIIGALRVTRQLPRHPYPIRDWTGGKFEPITTDSWCYGRAWVHSNFRRHDIHLYMVGLAIIAVASMGRTELEALIAPQSVLLPALDRSFGLRVSPRLDAFENAYIPCRVGPGDTPNLSPIELRINKSILAQTWNSLVTICERKFPCLNAQIEHDELLLAAMRQCGLEPSSINFGGETDVPSICVPTRYVLSEREFFGNYGEWESSVHKIQPPGLNCHQ